MNTPLRGIDIRRIRDALGLSAPKLAMVLGVHQSSIHRWEAAGDRQVPVEGIPRDLLLALRRRVVQGGIPEPEAKAKGFEIAETLAVAGGLVALGLLIAFALGRNGDKT